MPKSKKDPNKPKGVKSAYIYFTEHERAERERNGTSVKFTELAKICGPLWNEMDEEQRIPFMKLAEKDRKRYEKEMENYEPPCLPSSGEESDDEPKKKKTKKKDPNAPKRPMTAYFQFAGVKRPEIKAEEPNLSITEQAKKIGALWQALTPAEKIPYEKLADKDKERYAREMEEYNRR